MSNARIPDRPTGVAVEVGLGVSVALEIGVNDGDGRGVTSEGKALGLSEGSSSSGWLGRAHATNTEVARRTMHSRL